MSPETERETKVAVISALLTALILGLATPFVSDIWNHAADFDLPRLSKTGKLSLVATLFAICIVQFIWIWKLVSKRLFLRQYESDPSWPGTAVHRKTKRRVCDNCLQKRTIALALHYDPNNQRYGCGECGRQINPLPSQ